MSSDFKMGKTIVGARGRERKVESARIAARKRLKRRNVLVFGVLGVAGVLVVVWGVMGVIAMIKETEEGMSRVTSRAMVPSVEIVSEGGGEASVRVREFVAKLEEGFLEEGLVVERVVLPAGMMREVDVYLVGRGEYFKMSIDRGVGVGVEDAARVMGYLDEHGLSVSYVDLRVEGKAYYK